jgi:PPK2 family polyphosphate:nucleotide phosphotransferase
MKTNEAFRVEPGSKVKLHEIDPSFHGKHQDNVSAAAELAERAERIRALQYRLSASAERALLIVLQGMDASGKDGSIAHVFSTMNPQGVSVAAFKQPTPEELAHDFLWRVHARAPARGVVGIFNRSHYEDILVRRVHQQMSKDEWSNRCDRINDFEKCLVESGGAHILKFYLHISEDEQLERLKRRLEDPARQWKITEADLTERRRWPAYIEAYEDAFRKTSTAEAPWYIIPANHKWFRNLTVSRIVVDAMESLHLQLPRPTVDIEALKRKLTDRRAPGE